MVSADKLLHYGIQLTRTEWPPCGGLTPSIHMTRAGYRTLADQLIVLATSETPFTNSRGKHQTDESKQRNTWVAANSVAAKRRKVDSYQEVNNASSGRFGRHHGHYKHLGGKSENRRGGGYGRRF